MSSKSAKDVKTKDKSAGPKVIPAATSKTKPKEEIGGKKDGAKKSPQELLKEKVTMKDFKSVKGNSKESANSTSENAGKKAQKESKAQQKIQEAVEKEKWRKQMMLESDEEEEEESKLSDADEVAFREGMQRAAERSAVNDSLARITTTTSTSSLKQSDDTVVFHEELMKNKTHLNCDSPIEPVCIEIEEDTATTKKKAKENSKKVALARALAKQEIGGSLSNKERRALAKQTDKEAEGNNEDMNKEQNNNNSDYLALIHSLRNFSLSDISVDKKIEESLTKDIIIDRFSLSAPQKPLFVQAELRLSHGSRYGLLGPNGQGKTTILKHLAARVLPIPSHIRVMYVEQEVEASELSAVQTVLLADEKLTQLLRLEADLVASLGGANADSLSDVEWTERNQQLDQLERELETSEADTAEGRVRKILAGLGFSPQMQEQPTNTLSGGWRMRVSLARALFINPDLLLLDEPTNHLDLSAVIWLENHLQQRKGTLVVVSHDQDFLNNVVTNVILVEDKKLGYFRGDYDDFVAAHEARLAKQTKDFEKQQKALKAAKAKGLSKQEAEAKVIRQTTGRQSTPADPDTVSSGLFTRVKEYSVDFIFPNPEDDRPYLQVNALSFRYTATSPLLFDKLSFGVNVSTKAVIVGPNGAGKTSLLNLLSGALIPTSGEVRRNGGLRIGRYSQHFSDSLPLDHSPVTYLAHEFADQKEQSLRRLLGRFGLEGTAHTIPLKNLSGGQKARVVLASLVLQRPHILCLDEPTNHLDIESINALIRALTIFTGGVVMVSHDARLISSVNAKLWVCGAEGGLEFYGGNFDAYRKQVLANLSAAESAQDAKTQNMKARKVQARAQLRERLRRSQAR